MMVAAMIWAALVLRQQWQINKASDQNNELST
jgi:hypothetical protein